MSSFQLLWFVLTVCVRYKDYVHVHTCVCVCAFTDFVVLISSWWINELMEFSLYISGKVSKDTCLLGKLNWSRGWRKREQFNFWIWQWRYNVCLSTVADFCFLPCMVMVIDVTDISHCGGDYGQLTLSKRQIFMTLNFKKTRGRKKNT